MSASHTGVDRRAVEPLYVQIADDLRKQIHSGTRVPGATLPPEQALQDIYGVSRSVVRQALDQLAQDGLISREQGRGTVILPSNHHRRQAGRAGGLRQQIAALGGNLSTRIISLERAAPPAHVEEMLSESATWRLERVRFVDGDPLIHMVTWIPLTLTPGLNEQELDGGSLHDWLRGQGLDLRGGPRQLRAAAASELTAGYLGVAPGSPVTLLDGMTKDGAGRVIEVFEAWHHPSTVFDLEAEVASTPSRAEQVLKEIRSMLSE